RLEHTLELAARLPADVCLVSESGIRTRQDVERLQTAGVKAILVGETLMRADDVGARLDELRGVTAREAKPGRPGTGVGEGGAELTPSKQIGREKNPKKPLAALFRFSFPPSFIPLAPLSHLVVQCELRGDGPPKPSATLFQLRRFGPTSDRLCSL